MENGLCVERVLSSEVTVLEKRHCKKTIVKMSRYILQIELSSFFQTGIEHFAFNSLFIHI